MTTNTYATREQWLVAAMNLAKPDFEAQGKPIPDTVRVAIGNTTGRNAIGECWSAQSSTDEHREIWIKPYTVDPLEIIGVLVHELAHAALPHEVGHKRPFVTLIRALFLEGKPTATTIGDAFKEIWAPRLDALGPYPGGALQGTFKEKKKRPPSHIMFECDCGFKFHATKKAVDGLSGNFRCVDEDCDETPKPILKGDEDED